MTLDQALAYAREKQPSLLAVRARLAGQIAGARVPRTRYLPRVAATVQAFESSANNSTAEYVNTPDIDIPRIGGTPANTTSWSANPSTFAAAGLRQEVFDFGRTAALQAVADATVDMEKGLRDLVRLDVDFAVEAGYYSVQTAKGVLGAAEAAYQRSKLNYDTAHAGVDAGLRDPIQLTRAAADLGRFELARVNARGGLDAARSVFAAVVGVTDLMLDASGQSPPAAPAPSLDEAISSAFEHDPLLRAQRARIAQQVATTRVIASELHPDLSFTASISGRAGGASPPGNAVPAGGGWLPDVPDWNGGLVFTWPLLDFGVKAREEASRSFELARQSELAEVKQRLAATVQGGYVDLVSAQQALPALEKTLTAARANYAQAEARFKNDLGSSVELADAQNLLTTAEVDLDIGQYQFLRARAYLGRVIAEGL
ncbi:MAG TPA: TolC family protein [Anaeromyxobacteraceae bacterium]|nr:TolC family protein [Anaeromyxobacteraceae bacterium]